MKVKLTPYDSSSYLKNDEDIAAYLHACAEEASDDVLFMAKALEVVARARGMIHFVRESQSMSSVRKSFDHGISI